MAAHAIIVCNAFLLIAILQTIAPNSEEEEIIATLSLTALYRSNALAIYA
jgi:hypothetical protein